MKIILTAILILCQAAAFAAQTKKIRWATELCEFEGTYDSAKYTAAQLSNTRKLWFDLAYNYSLLNRATVWKIEDIAKLDLAALDQDYNAKTTELKKLDIIKSAYWEARRQEILNDLTEDYKLARIEMRAYADPTALREYAVAGECLAKYGEPLIKGGDELLTTWRQVNEASRRNNADPERLRKILETQYDSPDRLRYAQIEVMNFGWGNCAILAVKRAADGREENEKEFNKLFKRVRTVACDEP